MKSTSLVIFACLLWGCSRKASIEFVPPSGWKQVARSTNTAGVTPLFMGRRDEVDGTVSILIVNHAPTIKERNDARDFIGGYLERYWRQDTNMFMGQKLQTLKVSGHAILYSKASSAKLGPVQGNVHAYFIMTEGGMYSVAYNTCSEGSFDIGQLLKSSLRIEYKDAAFADEMTRYWVDAFAQLQSDQHTSEDRGSKNRLH